jgi:hypothetical protein
MQNEPKVHPNGPRIAHKNISKTQGYPQRSSERPLVMKLMHILLILTWQQGVDKCLSPKLDLSTATKVRQLLKIYISYNDL